MSDNEIESDEMLDDIDTNNDNENESSYSDKRELSKAKMESKRKLEEYLENKRLEDELNYY